MALPKKYKPAEVEKKWQEEWEKQGTYTFDPDAPGTVYSVDTPPPYVSADSLHVGHAMSYTQAEIVIRYHRMQGFNIFYPMGFDDNGLPTERHVEKKYGIDKSRVSRADFVKKCLEETAIGEKTYERLWRRLAISCDWNNLYTTISPLCQRVSQRSFLHLHSTGKIYRENAPSMWCPQCTTSLAQADMEDVKQSSFMHDIAFALEDGREGVISTTRPELLGACVALYVNPNDERYRDVTQGKARVPLYGHEVPILTSETVAMDVGTGLMMVCTFGDTEDIHKWRRDPLDMRVVLNADGTLNEAAGPIAGLSLSEGRKKIVALLEEAGLLRKSEPIEHALNVHERCGTTVEFLPAPQWFIPVLDIRDDLLHLGAKMRWFPAFMKTNYDHWVEGLSWDWCISRQRYYGVPFPVWYCRSCSAVRVAADEELPVDPRENAPPQGTVCDKCGGKEFDGEMDVMDTWMTSSLTPLINARWGEKDERLDKIYPMTLRPQAFEIIRTWLFYTVLKSHLHTDSLPFRDVMISGWGLDEKGKPFSKRKGNYVTPEVMIDKYSADGLRYWAAGAGLGQNLRFFEDDVKAGQKVVVKLWNVARFALPHLEKYEGGADVTEPIDLWILSELHETVQSCTEAFDRYEYSHARTALERFFWTRLCDNYLELAKDRLYNRSERGDAPWASACETLHICLVTILKMFAPILPFVTEEIFHLSGLGKDDKSIHVSTWPVAKDIPFDEEARDAGSLGVEILSCARRYKTENKCSLKTPLAGLVVETSKKPLLAHERFGPALQKDILAASGAKTLTFGLRPRRRHPTRSRATVFGWVSSNE